MPTGWNTVVTVGSCPEPGSAFKPGCKFHPLPGRGAFCWCLSWGCGSPQAGIQMTPAFRLPWVLQPRTYSPDCSSSSSAPTEPCAHLHAALRLPVSRGVTAIHPNTSFRGAELFHVYNPQGLGPKHDVCVYMCVCLCTSICELCQHHQQQLTHKAEHTCLPTRVRELICPHNKPGTSNYSHFTDEEIEAQDG